LNWEEFASLSEQEHYPSFLTADITREGLVSMAAAMRGFVLFDRLARGKEDYEAEEYTDPVEAAEDVDK